MGRGRRKGLHAEAGAHLSPHGRAADTGPSPMSAPRAPCTRAEDRPGPGKRNRDVRTVRRQAVRNRRSTESEAAPDGSHTMNNANVDAKSISTEEGKQVYRVLSSVRNLLCERRHERNGRTNQGPRGNPAVFPVKALFLARGKNHESQQYGEKDAD